MVMVYFLCLLHKMKIKYCLIIWILIYYTSSACNINGTECGPAYRQLSRRLSKSAFVKDDLRLEEAKPTFQQNQKTYVLQTTVKHTLLLIDYGKFLTIAFIVVILLALRHYYIKSNRNDKKLLILINELEKDLLISRNEVATLQYQLECCDNHTANDNSEGSDDNLELDVDIVSSSMQLKSLLDERSQDLVQTMSISQENVDDSDKKIHDLKLTLDKITEEFNKEIDLRDDKIQELEEDNLQKEELISIFQDIRRLQSSEISEYIALNKEINVNDEHIQELEQYNLQKEELIASFQEVKRLQSSLITEYLAEENNTSDDSVYASLEERIVNAENHLDFLSEKHEAVENERREAVDTLRVLSDYFKDTELQLKKQLKLQESILNQNDIDSFVINQKIQVLQAENENLKSQNTSLRNEIFETDAFCNIQIRKAKDEENDCLLKCFNLINKVQQLEEEVRALHYMENTQRTHQEASFRRTVCFTDRSVRLMEEEIIPPNS